jgi:predicted metal-dependent enzyme (double-stranded beta helix superfamily)
MGFDVDDFIDRCRTALAETPASVAVKEVVAEAIARPTEIDTALGAPERGGLRPLHRSEDLTVIQFIWSPRVRLFPHDHRMWAVNGIYAGSEDNTFYRRSGDGIEVSGGKELREGDIGVLGETVIHAVTNPSDRYTAAIHVYGGDYFGTPRSQWDAETLAEEPFDVEAVRRVLAEADRRAAS